MRDSSRCVSEKRAEKKRMRQAYKAVRESLLPEDKARFDACIEEALLDSMSVRYSGKILAYASLAGEVETTEFCRKVLACGRELYLPKSYPGGILRFFAVGSLEDLQKGAFGVLEPEERLEKAYVPSLQKPDLCLVPGICFDVYGYRIGYGKGYYDRFLANFTGVSMGLAYEACVCRDALPIEKRTDKPVDFIVTEKGINKRVCP